MAAGKLLDGAKLLASLDRHFARGNKWLTAPQLAAHRVDDWCVACRALEAARQASLAANQQPAEVSS